MAETVFDAAAAGRFAKLALDCVHSEYPNKIAHALNSDADVRPPRELTPAFYGCFDWHSCVHGHWLLVRLARQFPRAGFAAQARLAVGQSLTPENIAQEVRYLNAPGRGTFERPYGLAWLLQLAAELHEWDDPDARRWAANLKPLEDAVTARLSSWLPKLAWPIRTGEHNNTGFSLGLMLDYARVTGNTGFGRLVESRARDYYLKDKACPVAYEPSGEDFLSPCLAEADVVRRILPAREFAVWLTAFLPRIEMEPTVVTDVTDGKMWHLAGLNLSRAWMLEGIVSRLPAADPRRKSLSALSARLKQAGLASITGEHYEGGHWLGSFAVYLVSGRGVAAQRVQVDVGGSLVCMRRRDALGVLAAAAAQPLVGAPARQTFGVEGDRFILNGKPWVIRSGEMHYARVPREYWRDRMKKMRAMGLNTLCMYSFWNLHEPRPGEFDFSGNLDIAAFIRTAQEEGLWVIVRPGPYSCAEWEFGGYPSWLFKDPDIKVRTTDPRFLEPAARYLKRLVREVVPMQITRGGPVILAQVENEYGSFGKDKEYLKAIRRMLVDGGLEIKLYTSDGSLDYMLNGGTMPDLLSVVNFGGNPREEFANFAKFRKGVPLMCGEYWVGWFDHWGEKHHTGDNKVHLDGLNWMLERNISFNLYMVHGGTSFGPMAGANFDKVYQPDITSYDYDSPIDEAGRPAKKFAAYRAVIEKHLLPGEVIPELPAPLPLIEVPRLELKESAPLLAEMKPVLTAEKPQTFESIGLDYGFVLYETPVEAAGQGKLRVEGLHDYAVILQGGRVLGRLDRRLEQDSLDVELKAGETLRILVENMGRINFGLKLMEDRKGILGAVSFNGQELHGWSMSPYQIGKLPKMVFAERTEAAPAFWRGSFALAAAADTYIDTQGWGKGYVWVNSHCLGRHWKIGPQQTLYCPKQFLKRGVNEVVVLDLEDGGPRTLAGVKDPVWANS